MVEFICFIVVYVYFFLSDKSLSYSMYACSFYVMMRREIGGLETATVCLGGTRWYFKCFNSLNQTHEIHSETLLINHRQ